MIASPTTRVTAEGASSDAVEVPAATDRSLGESIDRCLTTLRGRVEVPPARLTVVEHPPQHRGFGVTTSVLLSALAALRGSFDLDVSDDELVAASGRGGASGVGVHGFFSGGFIVDAGHPRSGDPRYGEGASYLPSGSQIPVVAPTLSIAAGIPESWRFHLFLLSGPSFSGSSERRFFEENTPLDTNEVLMTLAAIYHGLVPAIRESNLDAVASALATIHSVGFKHRELVSQPASVREAYARLLKLGFATGLSSMGPLLYVITDENTRGEEVAMSGFPATGILDSYLDVLPANSAYYLSE